MQAIISFCKKSNVLTVAEGVEEDKELEAVQGLGVDAVQGYLLARPSPEINPEIFTRKFGS
jgi:EAL domain-containing protein (putative c-di-GMP-specific phosphodiesterase class I)